MKKQNLSIKKALVSRLRKLIEDTRKTGVHLLWTKYQIGKVIIKEKPIERDEKGRIKYGEVIELVEIVAKELRYSQNEIYHSVRFASKFNTFERFMDELESAIEGARKQLSDESDKSQLEEEMRTWRWVQHNMLYDKGEGTNKERVDFEADTTCEFTKHELWLENVGVKCDGDVTKLKLCGSHLAAVERLINKAPRLKR
ncbi:MAG: hypothetical protein ACRECH_08640 [Nitrososphaerales archaeon]